MAEQTASGYIQHHLQNLTYGQLPNGDWGFAHTAAEAKAMGFWAFHVDTLGWSLALGLILIGVGIGMSGGGAGGWSSVVQFTLLAFSGTIILYSLWIVMIALTFWFIKFDNNVTILQAMLDTGRYPATVYPPWLRMIVTFIVPVAVATTVPLQALRGELSGLQVLLYLAIGAAAFWLSTRIWRAGVKRYSGASA